MKNIAIVLLLIAVGILGSLEYSQTAALRQQRRQFQELTAKLDSMSRTPNLDLQDKCAKQAHAQFKLLGWESSKHEFAEFSNHYSTHLSKCFVEIHDTDMKNAAATGIFISKQVIDAFEGKLYGEYYWKSDKVKKYWEVPPIMCTVTLPSGEERTCHSDDEFNELVKPYMDE